jgi:hypothetical protein
MSAPWDYSTSEGIKLYFQSTAATVPKYDGTEANLKLFLKSISAKAKTFGWDKSILTIPDDNMIDRDLTKQYGMVTINNVSGHAMTYIGTDTRSAQASTQLAECISVSLGESVLLKLLLRSNEYSLNGVEDGPCMLKTLISVVTVETRATVSCIRAALKRLPTLMEEVDSDITEFNLAVGKHMDKLRSMNQTCEDLLNHLFEAYQTASDKTFVAYIADKEAKWEDNTIAVIEPESLMTLAEEKFKTLKLKKTWNAPTKEEASIIAMKAEMADRTTIELIALRAEVANLKGDSGNKNDRKRGKSRNDGDWAWKTVAPTGSQPREKTFKGKSYIYCMFHGDTKWVLKENHVDGCRNDPAGKTKESGTEAKKQPAPGKKTLQYAKALMHAMEGLDGDLDGEDEEI